MKKLKVLIALLVAIVSLIPVSVNADTNMPLSKNTVKYYAVIMGTTENEIINLYEEKTYNQYTDDMYNQENGIDASNVTLSLNLKDCAILFDINEADVQKHIELCGINVYNKIINYFENNFKSNINTISSGGGSDSSNYLPTEMWADIYKNAHTGNILITKDSINYNYRHGHIGVIQNHNSLSSASYRQ